MAVADRGQKHAETLERQLIGEHVLPQSAEFRLIIRERYAFQVASGCEEAGRQGVPLRRDLAQTERLQLAQTGERGGREGSHVAEVDREVAKFRNRPEAAVFDRTHRIVFDFHVAQIAHAAKRISFQTANLIRIQLQPAQTPQSVQDARRDRLEVISGQIQTGEIH